MTTKDEQLIFWCFRCKKNYEKDFNNKPMGTNGPPDKK